MFTLQMTTLPGRANFKAKGLAGKLIICYDVVNRAWQISSC
jgi:hypothetical protein